MNNHKDKVSIKEKMLSQTIRLRKNKIEFIINNALTNQQLNIEEDNSSLLQSRVSLPLI